MNLAIDPVAKTECLKRLRETVVACFSPPPTMTVSEWADTYRVLSVGVSARPGPWNTSRCEYLREIMDCFSDPNVRQVWGMCGSQVGKSSVLECVLGYKIDLDPGPMLFVAPKDDKAKEFSRERLAPMLRDTPVLRGRIDFSKRRDNTNTIQEKSFPGGHLAMVGANSPSNLASRPRRDVLGDEIDKFAESAGSEGDPLDLAIARTSTFYDRKIGGFSTPGIAGLSRIQAAFSESDQRYYHVPCKDCGLFQRLDWEGVKFDSLDGVALPETARYECKECKSRWSDFDRNEAVKRGKWIASQPFNGIAGFQISQLYAPWKTLRELVEDFLAVKHSRSKERWKTWRTHVLGEPWEDSATSLEASDLIERVESYGKNPDGTPVEVPDSVCVLTAGVDVHDDRLEVDVKGWTKDEESYGIIYKILEGDPDLPEVWHKLDQVLFRKYKHESGLDMRIISTAIDTGGHKTVSTYKYCKARRQNRVHAIKGRGGFGISFVAPPSRQNRARIPLYMISADEGKQNIFHKLSLTEHGPGYCHFPMGDRGYNDEYFRQLASEKLVTQYTRGVARRVWKQTRDRNEALDCFVYAYAALMLLNPNLQSIHSHFRKRVESKAPEPREAPLEAADIGEDEGPEIPDEPHLEHEEPTVQIPEKKRRIFTRPSSPGWVNSWK